ncbi:hypothetical protein AXX12_09540 [Anaerosporomusa subterranea]|uniref:Proteasome subunit beta n=1 Tax=Anaerosporomusa subterranea TaxID=1794912 RepID=A0A154BRJ6_ANASB|nr:hypothetical protein [Anaerosporomusa subterranea]KYZ76653.1 hypothetical protein AXX12_09540 [Anaerosporomusa subterranea]
MTIAISIKVNDGVVMATDSAATMFSHNGNAAYIYNNANKLFNVPKGLPIGLQTAGLGGIGQASIGTLVKDFRNYAMSTGHQFNIDPTNYTIQDVAEKFKQFIFDMNYNQAFQTTPVADRPYLGFHIAGYSTGQSLPEVWRIYIAQGQCNGPINAQGQGITGICWDGEPEPVIRLMKGFGTQLPTILANAGIPPAKIQDIMNQCGIELDAGFITAPMPIQDAAELAAFLVETASKWAKYRPGADSIGGHTDIAAITKHEGFKWIQRKQYYDKKFNS